MQKDNTINVLIFENRNLYYRSDHYTKLCLTLRFEIKFFIIVPFICYCVFITKSIHF